MMQFQRIASIAITCWGLLVAGSAPDACPSAADRAFGVFKALLEDFEGGVQRFWQNGRQRPFMLQGEGRNFKWLFNFDELSAVVNPKIAHPQRMRRKDVMTYDDAIVICRWTEKEGKVNHPLIKTRGVEADGDKAKALYGDGWSVLFLKPYRFLRNIFHFTGLLEQYVMFPVSQYIFVTPPNAQGFDFHYDANGAFQLQVYGSKNWSVFPPLVEDPSDTLEEDRIEEANAPARILNARQEFSTREGDILWIPRGWYHRAAAVGAEGSVHLSTSPEKLMWVEIFHKLDLFDQQMLERHRTKAEQTATGGGIPLPLRREVPIGLGRMSVSDFRRDFLAVAKEAGIDRAKDVPEAYLADWLNDFVAGLTEEVLPAAAAYPQEALEGLPRKRGKSEVLALGIKLTTPLRITSTMAARVVSARGSGIGRIVLVKYSTGNSPVRYERKSAPLKLPIEAAPALRKILHVEQNPSGRFSPADIHGVTSEMQLKIAQKLVSLRIAVPEAEWHSGSGGFVPPLPSIFLSGGSGACTTHVTRSEL